MIAALQDARQGAPSSSGPEAGRAQPAADPMSAINQKLDQILALLQKDEADDAPDDNQENSDNGNPAD